ncbi:hypothetical protein [Jiangella aurantiaca]|uniref:hypothetical protein n=1 Tax=Jiangella aurantiaca TaxID=2530373 RepID=UPI00193DEC3A|nr:hypothetical protein [Jiangella aurantiaca]
MTIFLIGLYSAESWGQHEQRFIKRELQASLYTTTAHSKNGILGIVLPDMQDRVYGGTYQCYSCGNSHNSVKINTETTISEFSYNYYLPNGKCSHTEDERYCVLTSWEDFAEAPDGFIEQAFEKRTAPIARHTKVRP